MPELEKLLNSLYKDMPINKSDLVVLCNFSFINNIDDKKRIFELLDSIADSKGNTLIKQISIYSTNNEYHLKILVDTVYDSRTFS